MKLTPTRSGIRKGYRAVALQLLKENQRKGKRYSRKVVRALKCRMAQQAAQLGATP
jgi:hypothetical protein